ncbi:MAG: VOC family protein [Shimia sp.]|uniref:VOC family protein n=1 Tax=Shimia sp. TaxID=1954381 RepID=UPI004058D845
MEQRVSLITLGVTDLEQAAGFYEAMGWNRVPSPDGVIAFDLIGQTLGLYDRAALAEYLGMDAADVGGFSGVTLSYNVRAAEDVAPVLARAEVAGGRVLRAAGEVFWGGFIGYFSDLDGHVWEVAHNPFSKLSSKGEFRWEGY